MKRYLIPLVAAAAILTTTAASCDPEQVAETAAAVLAPDPAPAAPREVYLYPNDPPEQMCNLMNPAHPMPCNKVLDVCIDHADGYVSAKFIPEFERCTPAHPRWRDVCILQPEYAISYGYTPDECAAATP